MGQVIQLLKNININTEKAINATLPLCLDNAQKYMKKLMIQGWCVILIIPKSAITP